MTKKNDDTNIFLIPVLIVIIISIVYFSIPDENSDSIGSQKSGTYQYLNSQQSQESNTLHIVGNVAQQYYETHVYIPGDVFDCDNMAQDVWNMLKAKGISSSIMIGNVDDASATTLDRADHAWVMVELDGGAVAVETTNGQLVYRNDNPNYYHGFSFKDPKSFRDFLSLYTEYKRLLADYNVRADYYNRLVSLYNSANGIDQMRMESGIHVTKLELEDLTKRITSTKTRMDVILTERGS